MSLLRLTATSAVMAALATGLTALVPAPAELLEALATLWPLKTAEQAAPPVTAADLGLPQAAWVPLFTADLNGTVQRATPLLQRPLALGADIVMHSTTKYFGGHSDVLGGALVFARDDAFARHVAHRLHVTGAVLAPLALVYSPTPRRTTYRPRVAPLPMTAMAGCPIDGYVQGPRRPRLVPFPARPGPNPIPYRARAARRVITP